MAQDLEGTGVTANVLVPGGPANTRMIPDASGFARDNADPAGGDGRTGGLAGHPMRPRR